MWGRMPITSGQAALWVVALNGSLEFNRGYGPFSGWTATDLAVGADGKLRVLWSHTSGQGALWVLSANGDHEINKGSGSP